MHKNLPVQHFSRGFISVNEELRQSDQSIMELGGSRETYRAALEERKEKEMVEVEDWIDQTQGELYRSMSQEGRRRSSVLLSEECRERINLIIKDYEEKGFKKRRIQEDMEDTAARKPFEGSKYGTLREKHNMFMNFIFAIELKQQERRQTELAEMEIIKTQELEAETKLAEERRAEAEREEEERREAERRERERREAEARHQRWRAEDRGEEVQEVEILLSSTAGFDLAGNPLQLSEDKRNVLSSGRFIGSIYVGQEESWTERQGGENSYSWRVRL